MLKASFEPYTLHFKETAITSRSHMDVKETFIVKVWDEEVPDVVGMGECAIFRGLSAEDTPGYEDILGEACRNPSALPPVSSIRFGFETAIADLRNGGTGRFVDNGFTRGETPLVINGLIWMGDKRTMKHRIRQKLDAGFRCVKLKIGGIDFNDELDLLGSVRDEFSVSDVELRVDANGAFTPANAMERLERLSELELHSIEQPIRQGQWEDMALLCSRSPVPIALDEELIGFRSDEEKKHLLDEIRPQYIILKPSLCGGFTEADKWIEIAGKRHIGWWATSALESNVGLGAIAQWVSRYSPAMPQGLGTGALYTNNFPSLLWLDGDKLYFQQI